MRKSIKFEIKNLSSFKSKFLRTFKDSQNIAFLDNNKYKAQTNISHLFSNIELIIGVGKVSEFSCKKDVFNLLKKFSDKVNDYLFGFFSYDLKNDLENLKSENFDGIKFPEIYFFQAEYVFFISEKKGELLYLPEISKEHEVNELIKKIQNHSTEDKKEDQLKFEIEKRISKQEYIEKVNSLKKHIKRGDIYEANFCQEFYAENINIDPYSVFEKLNQLSPTPFAAFFRLNNKYLLSASPERFLKKSGKKIISQPIKGTIKRGKTVEEDKILKNTLKNDIKERAENIMIVDLVRNDLSHTAAKNSVKVEELCGIYEFEQVFQMISTISSNLKKDINFTDTIKHTFPPGSMTGAPKIRAMELIEKYEETKRGLYSGTIGYICPDKNFDFNVVIRSIIYNAADKYLSFMVGGAITDKSLPEKEYEECLLKAEAMLKALSLQRNNLNF